MAFPRARASSLSLSLLLLAGCNNSGSGTNGNQASAASAAPTESAPSAAPPASAPPKQDHHRGREGGGPVGTLFRAARELTLTDAQKTTLDDLESQAQTGGNAQDDFKGLQADVVSGIRAGKIESTKLQADYSAIDKTLAARQAKDGEALSGLYNALDAAQRKALVATVRTKEAVRDAQFASHPDLEQSAGDWSKHRLERLTTQLTLDDAQQKTVGALLAKGDSMSPAAMKVQREEGKKRMESVLAAFESDHFDPKKLDLGGMPGKTAHEGLEKDTTFLSQLVPLLTPEQREKLASQREHMGMVRQHHGEPEDLRPRGPALPE